MLQVLVDDGVNKVLEAEKGTETDLRYTGAKPGLRVCWCVTCLESRRTASMNEAAVDSGHVVSCRVSGDQSRKTVSRSTDSRSGECAGSCP